MRRRLAIIAVTVLVVYWTALFIATHVPDSTGGEGFRHADKLAHAGAYAILAWLAAMVLRIAHWPVLRICLTVLAVCAIYGALDEWLQGFTKRTASPFDWVADVVGAALGLIVFLMTHNRIRQLYRRRVEKKDHA